MTQDDLSRLKHVGVARMNLLQARGITTIKQLKEMPEEKLAEIKSIGGHYAKLIKNSVTRYYSKKNEESPTKAMPAKEKKIQEINLDLQKTIKKLKNSLSKANENLKPISKKKHLELYVDFKKRSDKLTARLDKAGQIQDDLSRKVKKEIIKRADTLDKNLKGIGKKPKKKTYKESILKIQSFSKMIRGVIA